MEIKKLIKIDRNGSKHYEGEIVCDRCGGSGIFAYCIRNGVVIPTIVDNGICHKCHGSGKVIGKWIERTPEYQAKLDARREAKRAEVQRAIDERNARERAEKEALEAKRLQELEARKARATYYGNIGDKIEIEATYIHRGSYERPSFKGFGRDLVYVHKFETEDGKVFVWKTQTPLFGYEIDSKVRVKATIKDHQEYREFRQNVITRAKITTERRLPRRVNK